MSADTICLIALLAGGLSPNIWIASRGGAEDRLVGLTLTASTSVFVLILFSQITPGQSYDLTLPLALVPLTFAGTLVFTRLLSRGPSSDG